MPEAVLKTALQVIPNAQFHHVYGQTEAGPVLTALPPNRMVEEGPLAGKIKSAGVAIPGVEIKIVDEDDIEVPRGTVGEICGQGENVMLGYWDDDERTAESIDAAGWMHTGDLGTMDEHGYGNVVGRIKDMVIRGGENVYPREIEEYLYRHDKIQDVQVIGVPDPKFVEELCAWIVLREGETADENEIKEFCRGQIAHYKVPRYIKFVDGFPMTVTGKVQKFVMREQMIEELNLEVAATA